MQYIVLVGVMLLLSYLIYFSCNRGMARNARGQQTRRLAIASLLACLPLTVAQAEIVSPSLLLTGGISVLWMVTYPLLYHLTHRHASPDYENYMDIDFGLYLFGGMTVAEVQNLLKLNPKSEIYFALERKFSGDNSPNGVEAMRILKQLDKNDPSAQLQAYFNAITGNPYTGDLNAKMESLADINAVNLNKIKILLEKYPALEQDESKQNELMNRLKTDKDFLSGNIESILASGFFKLKEEYQTKFWSQIDGLPISFEEKLALRQELHRIENTVNVNIQGFELEAHGEEIVLKAGGNREVKLNIKNKTLDGLVNTAGSEIPFETAEEALRVGFLILTLKWKIISQELHSDKLKKEDFGWPFDLSDGISQIWNGIWSIVFKEAGGTQRVVMGDLIPFWSTMDRKYPTIEKGDNRKFLIAHLNKIWELEAPNN